MRSYSRAVRLMEAELGDEFVALDAEAGRCFGFNNVAASVWRALERPRTFEELRNSLLLEYEVGFEQCSTDLNELLADLVGRGLVEETAV